MASDQSETGTSPSVRDVEPDPPTVKILLVDDELVLRQGLRLLFDGEPNLEVVAEADNVEEAVGVTSRPDVIVLDLTAGDNAGEAASARLRAEFPDSAILVLTVVDRPSTVQAVLAAGASGYVLKESRPGEVIDAVVRVSRGERYVQPSLGAAMADLAEEMGAARSRAEALTDRERSVLRLVALGYTNREMADILSLSLRTVESHRATIARKLSLSTRAEFVRYAAQNSIIDLTDSDLTERDA